VQDAAEILGIQELLKRKPRQLSGGQRQRVAVGRAIVRHPQVFLFDEPLSNLDAKLRVQMRVELKRLHERLETTAIYVTHDQVEAMTLGSRVVVMKDGWVQQVGEPLEIYSQPRTSSCGLHRSPSMNFIPVTLSDGSGALFAEASRPQDQGPAPEGAEPDALQGSGVTLGVRPEDLSGGRGLGLARPVLEPWSRWWSRWAPRSCWTPRRRGSRSWPAWSPPSRRGRTRRSGSRSSRSDPLLRRQDGAGDQVSSRLTVMCLAERALRGALGRGLPALPPMP